MTSKAQKRKTSTEISDDETAEGSAIPAALMSGLRSTCSMLAAHRWKAVGAAAVVVAGVLLSTGALDFGKLTSGIAQYTTPQVDQTATEAAAQSGAKTTVAGAAGVMPTAPAIAAKPSISTCFTPGENCSGIVATAIDGATSEILVQAYSLSKASIIDALGRARLRGVKVRVILDKADERDRNSGGARLISQRILPLVDTGVAVAHAKVIVIDRRTVITSSFNFDKPAQKNNAETLLVIQGHPEVAAAYLKNWDRRLAVSRPYYGTMAPVL